jgi:DNA-binding transcriptional LysR family regulator
LDRTAPYGSAIADDPIRKLVGETLGEMTGAAKRVHFIQIHYFITAAEHLNYARAAGALGVNRSTLSRQVHRLEDGLGVSLFERHRHGIRLTAAGRQFLARTQRFMLDFERAVAGAARAGRAEVGHLCLGVASSILSGPLQDHIGRYRRKLPDVDFHCIEGDDANLIVALRERQIDVAVGYADLLHSAGVTTMRLWRERLHVALPEGYSLSQQAFLIWSQFKGETIIVREWATPPLAYDKLAHRMPRGMRLAHHPVSRDTVLGLVAAGCGLAVVPGSVARIVFPGVVFRPIRESDANVDVIAAWLDESDNPAKVKFIAELRAFAKGQNLS